MAFKDLFKKAQFATIKPGAVKESREIEVPDGMFEKCPRCGKPVYNEKLEQNMSVCPECGFHHRIGAPARIKYTADEGSFHELFADIGPANPLNFPGYAEKIRELQEKTGLKEAVVTGTCTIYRKKVAIAVMDSRFMMASMGSVVGEKLTRLFEYAAENRMPVVLFTCSGGARMHEGIISLMQMAKVSGACGVLARAGMPYFTVLTDPTTGGVTASFAMLGDVILSEPGAIVGFAGRRVIEGTIGQKLPEDFQSAEFVQKHGFIDTIADRRDLRDVLDKLLVMHGVSEEAAQ